MGKRAVSKLEFAKLCGVTPGAITKFVQGRGKAAVFGGRVDLNHPTAQEYLLEKTTPSPVEPAPGVDPLFERALELCRCTGRWTASIIHKRLGMGYARAARILGQLQAAGHVPPTASQAKSARAPSRPPPPPVPKPAPRSPGRKPKTSWEDNEELIEVPDDIEELADLSLRELIDKFGTGYRFLDWLKALKEIEAVNEKRIKNAQSKGKLISRQLVEVGIIDPFNSAHVRLMTDGAKAITAAVLAKHQAGVSPPEIEAYVSDVVGSFIRPVKSKIERNLASVAID